MMQEDCNKAFSNRDLVDEERNRQDNLKCWEDELPNHYWLGAKR